MTVRKISLFLAIIAITSVQPVHAQTEIKDFPKIYDICANVENSLVASYLSNADQTYGEDIGLKGTSILNYNVLGSEKAYYLYRIEEQKDGSPNWAEQPQTVNIYTPVAGTVIISQTPDFSSGTFSFTATRDTTRIPNLVPQTLYWYRVIDAKQKIRKEGMLKTQGHLRMINSPKVMNVRDFGGWKCNGGRVAYQKIYRGATLDGSIFDATNSIGAVSLEDINILTRQLGITNDIDLRNPTYSKSPLGTSVSLNKYNFNHYVYLLTNTTYKSGKVTTSTYYSECRKALIDIAKMLSSGKSLYIHCQFGSDRAGTLVAIIKALLGVSQKDIVKDWELSSFMSCCYFKMIDSSETNYYYKSGTSVKKTTAELREFFQYLNDNYGGNKGATLQEQIITWLKKNVLTTEADQAYITTLQQQLIVPDVSPTILQSAEDYDGNHCYSITTDKTRVYNLNDNQWIDENDDKAYASDCFGTTDYIDSSNFKYLLTNGLAKNMFNFYDKDKKYIKGSGVYYMEYTVLFNNGYQQRVIPTGTKYIRFNIPKHSPWTAVFSYDSLKN